MMTCPKGSVEAEVTVDIGLSPFGATAFDEDLVLLAATLRQALGRL